MATKQDAIAAMKIRHDDTLTVIIVDHKDGTYNIHDCTGVIMAAALKTSVLTGGTMSKFIVAGLVGTTRILEMVMTLARGIRIRFPQAGLHLAEAVDQVMRGGDANEGSHQGTKS